VTDSIDLDRVVADTIHLESLQGAVERLLQQCHDVGGPACAAIRRVADSVTCDYHGPLRQLAAFRMYSALSVVMGNYNENRLTDYAAAVAALDRSRSRGVLSALDTESVTFRIDPLPDRWALRDRISAELNWRNEPGDWQVNITRRDDLLLAQVGALYHSRRFPAMRHVPASTNPIVAALLLQLLKPKSGDVVYDPFCGSGTLLAEAAAYNDDLVLLGSDLSQPGLAVASSNQRHFSQGLLICADAAELPVMANSVGRVVANIPFGKRVGSHADNVTLYPAFLGELTRVLRPDGRAVLLTEDKSLFRRSAQEARGVRLLREVRLASGGAHPSAFVLERTRTARRALAKLTVSTTGRQGR